MGYRNPYEDREKRFQDTRQDKPVNSKDLKKRLEGLFSPPKKLVENPCPDGHNWVTHRDGPVRCSRCKIPKPPDA